MLSQLLRHEANSLARQHQQQQQQSPERNTTSPQQSHSHHSPPTDSSTTASGANMSAASTAMQESEEHRPDLPRPYKCPLCDKAFHRLEHQTRHIRTHTGEKPHACQFPGCTKRFSRSDELTRHSRIHSNPNSRRGNKQNVAAAHAAAAAIQGGLYDSPAMQQVNPLPHLQPNQNSTQNHCGAFNQAPPMNTSNPMPSLNQVTISNGPLGTTHSMAPPSSLSQTTRSAPPSQTASPNITPPHSYANYPNHSPAYTTRNVGGDLSPAQGPYHPPMDINLLATAASQVERENNSTSYLPNQSLSLPARQHYYHNTPYHTGRMPSLSSYHYSSNPTSQPMSRSHSEDEQYPHRLSKKSKPNTPQSTAPPSPEFPTESTSPTPDHTPLATPSHSPRLRPQYFHNGVQLPTLNHLSLMNQPPPALAPVEPSADGVQPYIPTHHSGLRISEIMEAGDGAQRKLPIPMVSSKDSAYTKIHELMNPDSGPNSGRGSEAGSDLYDRH